jgi:hypothetical protein
MSESLDPLTAGVASALKSLRARAGLRESRLLGGGPALDTLAGLDSVRALVAAGQPVQQAIIQAVTAAASALQPTRYSIVADASLGLRLNVAELPELYADDLSARRDALLDNWDRLHELRHVTVVEPPPAPRALRIEVEAEALGALAAALTSSARTRGPAPGPAEKVRSAPPALLLSEFRRIGNVMRHSLVTGKSGTGWSQDLRKEVSRPATRPSTSYGLRAMLLLEGHLAPDLIPVAEFLRRADEGGGYFATSQSAARPEMTADVLRTLHRLDGTADYGHLIIRMKDHIGVFERSRPLILSCVLEASAQIGSDPQLTRSLVTELLATRRSYGHRLLWPEKAEEGLVAPVPSIVHTARAVCALAQVQAGWSRDPESAGDGPDLGQVQADAVSWLAEQDELGNVSEVIDRPVDGRVEQLYVRHFTAAWLLKALVLGGIPASHPTFIAATARIWHAYSPSAGLWRWRNGDLPVWMTMDAIEALCLAPLSTRLPPEVSGRL